MFRIVVTVSTVSALDLVLLPHKYADQGGRCMDGTMSGYYYAAPSKASDLWVIDVDGGGGCSTKKTCDRWVNKNGGKGSSKNWAKTKSPNKRESILTDDADINPDFYGAHKVRFPYCTGDGHTGTVVEPSAAQWGYYFSGHLNFELRVQHLIDTIPALRQASRVLLTGHSAGGIGVIPHCDFLQDKFASLGVPAKVSCAPRAGWFVPGFTDDQTDPELPPSSWAKWSIGQTGGAEATRPYQFYVHPGCAKAQSGDDTNKCGSASVVYPYIKAPMYVIENNYDTNQLFSQLGLPKRVVKTRQAQDFIAYFGRAMRNSTSQILAKSGDGLFLPSCFAHSEGGLDFDGTTKLKGFTSGQGLGDWFFGRKTVPTILVDDCDMASPGLPCNPTCPGVPVGARGVFV